MTENIASTMAQPTEHTSAFPKHGKDDNENQNITAENPVFPADNNTELAAGLEANRNTKQEWKPKILAFCCNWCTYAGADLAGLNRMEYPADIRLLRVPCSGRVNPQYILKAYQNGCDGVLVCGCHPGDCHYATGNYYAKRRMLIYKRLLEYLGLEPDRFIVRWISGSEAGKFRDTVIEVTERIKELGPLSNDLPHLDEDHIPHPIAAKFEWLQNPKSGREESR